MCFNLNHLHASIYTIEHTISIDRFLSSILFSYLFEELIITDKNSSFFWKMYTQAGIDMRFVCYPQLPPILTVYLYQSFIYKYFLNHIFLHSESVLKRCILLNPFPNSNMCVLFLRGSNKRFRCKPVASRIEIQIQTIHNYSWMCSISVLHFVF